MSAPWAMASATAATVASRFSSRSAPKARWTTATTTFPVIASQSNGPCTGGRLHCADPGSTQEARTLSLMDATPHADGFHMPAEWEPQDRCYMVWPERPDNWRLRALPAQATFTAVAEAVAKSEPVTMLASADQWEPARAACS